MRIFWLDNLKAIGIFLVIFGHILPDSHLKQYIYSFHVPLFFFVSGYLFDRTKYTFKQFFKKKLGTLIVPYLTFAVFSFLFWLIIVRNLSIGGKALVINPLKPLIGIIYGIGSEGWRSPMNVALWFLPCLFIVEVMFYPIKNRSFIIVFAIIGVVIVPTLQFRLPLSFDVALTAIVFYGMGNLYHIKETEIWLSHKAIPLLLILHLVFCFANSPVDMNNLRYGNVFYFYISACSGVLFYVSILKLVKKNILLEYVGSNTIILIGFVDVTWFILRGIFYILFRTKLEYSGLGFGFIASIMQIVFSIPAIYCINQWFPFVIGKSEAKMLYKCKGSNL